jgi:endonuclease/exonuclease/phosphatase family metal-dependent hydrolase
MNTPAALILGALALAIFVAMASAEDQDQDAPSGLRVLSANIRFGLADDGAHAWKKREALTVETLVEAKPDILGLQEALGFQVAAVHKAFPGHSLIGEGRDAGGKGEWCAILVDSQRFSIRASGTFRLSPDDKVGAMGWDAACTRIATWAELEDRKSPGATLLVLNAHFDHVGKEARAKSAELLVSWGKARQKARGETPVILLGDLNAEEASPPLELLKQAGMRDTFRVKHPEAEEDGTFHGFQGGRDGRRIDFVLATKHWRVEDAWIDWTEKDGRYPSDHRFVGATLVRKR